MTTSAKHAYISGVRAVVYNRSGGYCEVLRDGIRCGKPLGPDWQLAHVVARGKLERAARRAGADPDIVAWRPRVLLASCPACNDAALIGRGLAEDDLIGIAVAESLTQRDAADRKMR